ncbi:uncharacterized protein IL334_000462 [Kwoniella shivajii]|uniref:Xylose isomerase-like TIM barrel domain-containing protein n=1 Tax=Kwoniella shivajii TaxID=564305 RepID=A0ABZ1CQA8_9TREE|nr:hypothetical protein IL334_000462 [Kwoniella shivajii]
MHGNEHDELYRYKSIGDGNEEGEDETEIENFNWFDLWDDLIQFDSSLLNFSDHSSPLTSHSESYRWDKRCAGKINPCIQNHVDSRSQSRTGSSYSLQTSVGSRSLSPTPTCHSLLVSSTIEITLQSSPAKHEQVGSPLSALGLCTPGKSVFKTDLKEEVISPPTLNRLPTYGLLSPLNRLSLCSPGKQHPTLISEPQHPLRSITPPPGTTSLSSPLHRLGLCSPSKDNLRSIDNSITPKLKPQIVGIQSISPTRFPKRPELPLPSPGWVLDTPTPIRFYPPSTRPVQPLYDLTIPRQPQFNLTPRYHIPTTDIKPDLLITPPLRFNRELREEHYDLSPLQVSTIAHCSSEGGLARSLRKLELRLKRDPSVSGLNMFINPPKRRVRERDSLDIIEAGMIMRRLGDDFRRNSMAHAVHTTNLLSSDPKIRRNSIESIVSELQLARSLGIPTLVIHLGSEGRNVHEDCRLNRDRIDGLISDLEDILGRTEDVNLAIENTVQPSPGSMTTLQSLSLLLTIFPHPRLKICLDLAHLHVSELNLNNAESQKDLFLMLEKMGKERIAGLHVGGSWTEHGGKRDRHANIGSGTIRLSSIRSILRHPICHQLPTLLETPGYHRYLRHSSSSYSMYISTLEFDRSALERQLVQDIVNISDTDWDTIETKLFNLYKKKRRKIENRLYKFIKLKGTNDWERFRKGRRKEMTCCRMIQGKKRRIALQHAKRDRTAECSNSDEILENKVDTTDI